MNIKAYQIAVNVALKPVIYWHGFPRMFNWPISDRRVQRQVVVHSDSSLQTQHCRGLWKMFQGF